MILWIFALIFLVVFIFNIVGLLISAPKYSGVISDHFNGKTFVNPGNVQAKGLKDVIKWSTNRNRQPWQEMMHVPPGPKPDPKVEDGIKITFVNHSTFLIQAGGLNILTDPIWSERTSPVQFAGPKRMRPPGILFTDLPNIDYVIVSHNHYDHLDVSTMKKLIEHHGPKIITPLGVAKYVEKLGSVNAIDMDWWDERNLEHGLKIACVPAQHFSGRGTYDRDATLWCGYIIMYGESNIYFVGDSGYGNFFKEIREAYGGMKVSLIPIGAYLPQWFMSPIHISPAEAVKVHQDVESEISIGMHFGTFPLADDGQHQPVEDLKKALNNAGIHDGSFRVIEEGESVILN